MLSTVTNIDTSSVVPIQTYVVNPMNNIRGEKNSQRVYNDAVYFETVYINDIHYCETAADAKNVANLALPCASSCHFNSYLYPLRIEL